MSIERCARDRPPDQAQSVGDSINLDPEDDMKTWMVLGGLAASLMVVSASSFARPGQGDGINARQHRQHARIEQGVRSGELNRHEARWLGREQRMIRNEERLYRSDGRLSPWERRDLQRDLNRADRHIYSQKHDDQTWYRPGWNRDPGVDRRQDNQHDRIRQGIRSGELTRGETRGLRQDQREIRQEEREYRSDGKLTRDERRDLHQDLNQASRDIYEQKHDDERRVRIHDGND